MAFFVYMLVSGRNGTLYLGSTEDLVHRVGEHVHKEKPGFTTRYGVTRLVYYEWFDTREAAFARERAMKKWNRAWKVRLIEEVNPEWRDLYPDFFKPSTPGPLSQG